MQQVLHAGSDVFIEDFIRAGSEQTCIFFYLNPHTITKELTKKIVMNTGADPPTPHHHTADY